MARKKATAPIDCLVNSEVTALIYERLAKQPPPAPNDRAGQAARKWTIGKARQFRRAFASRLRALREAAGLSINALARAAGIDDGFLTRLEAGESACGLETAVKIGGALGVELKILVPAAPKGPGEQ
jgi:ribosome-binding protein aMBF1 (putative translation factor)